MRGLILRGALGAVVVLVAAALTAVVLGAVSGDSDERSGDSNTEQRARGAPPSGDGTDSFRSCLEDQGVEVQEGPPSGDPQEGFRDGDFRRAIEACREFLPQDRPPGEGPPFGGGQPGG